MSTSHDRICAMLASVGLDDWCCELEAGFVLHPAWIAFFWQSICLDARYRPNRGRRQLPTSTRCSFAGQVVPPRLPSIIPAAVRARGRRLASALIGGALALGASTPGLSRRPGR